MCMHSMCVHTKRACVWMSAALCWNESCCECSAARRRSWSCRTFSSFRRAADSRSPTRVHWRPSTRAAKNSSTAAFSERSASRRTAPPVPLLVLVPGPLPLADGAAVVVLAGAGALSPAPGVSALATLASGVALTGSDLQASSVLLWASLTTSAGRYFFR